MNKSSKLKIYQTAITPKKNMVVDDIDIYLSKLTPTIDIPDFQYQKIGLDIEIKVPADQSNVGNNALGNYVSIEQDDRVYYFFIMGAEWKNPMCVGLNLSIDTLNTFDKDLEWSPQTLIKRRHKDRFYNIPIAENKSTHTKTFVRNIDRMKEGIQLPFINKESATIEQYTGEKTGLLDWYLIYQTRKDLKPDDISSPVDCYVCTNKQLPLRDDGRRKEIVYTKQFLTENRSMYFTTNENSKGVINVDGVDYELGKEYTMVVEVDGPSGVIIGKRTLLGVMFFRSKVDDELYYGFLYNDKVNCEFEINGTTVPVESDQLSAAKPIERITIATPVDIYGRDFYFNKMISDSVTFKQSDALEAPVGYNEFWFLSTLEEVKEKATTHTPVKSGIKYIKSFEEVDKTDSKLMKIIKLPYSPATYNAYYDEDYDRDFFFFDNTIWEVDEDERLLRLKPTKTTVELKSNVEEIDLIGRFTENIQLNEWEREGIFNKFESKLYSSEFYIYKFVYDSFAKDIALERIRAFYNLPSSVKDLKFPIEFKVTNTINSKMAFKFDIPLYDEVVDYEKFLIINRNNEEPIYSNDYVNYIRNGYNYDMKAKNIANASAGVSLGLQAASTVAASLVPYSSGGKVISNLAAKDRAGTGYRGAIGALTLSNAYTTAISQGSSLTSGVVSTISGIMERENQMKGNLQNLSQQSTVVQGSDDVDLLSYYNKNKLEIKIYAPIEQYQKMLTTLFHYTGYADATRDFPTMHTRREFDYMQCEAVFYGEETSSYADYLEDIKARYAAGVTRFHNILPKEGGLWHFSQASENIELSILRAFEEDEEVEETPEEPSTSPSIKPDINKPGVDFGKPDIPNITSADNGGNN